MQFQAQTPFTPRPGASNRAIAVRLSACAVGVAGALFLASPAMSAGQNPPSAQARYQAERTVCTNGSSNQDRATCLREAAAAYKTAKAGQFKPVDEQVYGNNRLIRCEPLLPQYREACIRRMQGEGTVEGSAQAGGVMRELVIPSAPVK